MLILIALTKYEKYFVEHFYAKNFFRTLRKYLSTLRPCAVIFVLNGIISFPALCAYPRVGRGSSYFSGGQILLEKAVFFRKKWVFLKRK